MDYNQIPMILTLAFGLGLLHSLDADHIMAVSNLASGRPNLKITVQFCLRWAIGHGLTLFIIGLLVFALGYSLPSTISLYAEFVVGIILVAIGIVVLFDAFRKHAHIHFHKHDGLPAHAHWHSHKKEKSHRHTHTALFVGMVHGLAGSAPLLALIPVAMSNKPVYGFIYLVIFSMGVLCAMLLFGGVLGLFTKKIIDISESLFSWVRGALGFGAIGAGMLVIYRIVQ